MIAMIAEFYHRSFDSLPKFMRIICRVSFFMFLLVGLRYAIPATRSSFGLFLLILLIFLAFGIFTTLVVAWIWNYMNIRAKKFMHQRLSEIYQEKGFSLDMAEMAKNGNPYPDTRELLLHIFLLVMAEDYHGAEEALLRINTTGLSGREAAVYYTCRIQIFAMTAQYEKAQKLFYEQQFAIEQAYDLKPHLFDQYLSYCDDALTYYTLAAAFSAQTGDQARAAEYRKRAEFQISARSQEEIYFQPHIFTLAMLYASGQLVQAHEMENALRGDIERGIMPNGYKQNLLRMTAQARVFAAFTQFARPRMTERRLPGQ